MPTNRQTSNFTSDDDEQHGEIAWGYLCLGVLIGMAIMYLLSFL